MEVRNHFNDENIIKTIFTVASYTYGPLLGLFMFGLFTKRKLVDRYVPFIVILSPVLSYIISLYDTQILNGFNFGPDLIIINGLITYFRAIIFIRILIPNSPFSLNLCHTNHLIA